MEEQGVGVERFRALYRRPEGARMMEGDDPDRGVIAWLDGIAEDGEIRSLLDLGCGTLKWISGSRAVTKREVAYYGVDIVPGLIKHHQRVLPWFDGHAETLETFVRYRADVVILRDVLDWHCNGFCEMVLDFVERGHWRYFVVNGDRNINNRRRRGITNSTTQGYNVEQSGLLRMDPAYRFRRGGGGEMLIYEKNP